MDAKIAVALLLTLALLAGCSSKDKSQKLQVCPDGTSYDINTVAGHDKAGFDPVAHCPVKPSMVITALPVTMGAYSKASIAWELRNGTIGVASDPPHSMISEIRISNTSIPDSALKGPGTYGVELPTLERQHQTVPEAFNSTLPQDSVFFTTPGTRYIRAYMEFRVTATSANYTDVWSTEHVLQVTAPKATGVTKVLDRPAGPSQVPAGTQGSGAMNKTLDMKLGDKLVLKNDDATTHTFSFIQAPAGAKQKGLNVTRDSMTASDPLDMLVPGTYVVSVDEPGTPPVPGVVPAGTDPSQTCTITVKV